MFEGTGSIQPREKKAQGRSNHCSLAPKSGITLHRGAQDKGELEHVPSGEIVLLEEKIFSTVKTTRCSNILPREVVGVCLIEIFKTWLDRALDLMPCF